MKFRFLVLFSLVLFTLSGQNKCRFASAFTNNMILQQNENVKIWGFSNPMEKITLTVSWSKKVFSTVSGQDGQWVIAIKTPKASNTSHHMTLLANGQLPVKVSNILMGEVWLCSGQSNMEMVLQSMPEWNLFIQNSAEVIAAANDPEIRVLTVGRKESFEPQTDIYTNGWKVCNPENAKWFSAVAYFFGKKLRQELKVPIGLVVSSYGGSPVQSWLPQSVVDAKSIYKPEKESREAELKVSHQTEDEYINAMAYWITESEKQLLGKYPDSILMYLPVNLENSSVGNQLGEVAFTKEIVLPDKNDGEDLCVSLGRMDDMGRVFFNGELVWSEIRNSKSYADIEFKVSADKIRQGENRIEARVLNVLWGGGLTGPADKMYYTSGDKSVKTSLAGNWNYSKVFDLSEAAPVPREGKPLFLNSSALFNGMICPLLNMSFRGCIWYQGEGNVGDNRYAEMFADMINAWRKEFKQHLPFYFVQIAPYNYGDPNGDKAVLIRDMQNHVAQTTANAHIALTIDLGDPNNIHPARKKEVGDRLALLALANTYRKNFKCNYPEVENVTWNENTLILKIKNTYKGLKTEDGKTEMEISENGVDYFQATTKISGNQIEVFPSAGIVPKHIRYCWHNISKGNIFNSEGLPLSSFKIEAPLKSKHVK